MDLDISFLQEIESFLRSSGMTATRLGESSVKDPNLVFDVRKGRWCKGPLKRRVLQYIQAYESKAPQSEAA